MYAQNTKEVITRNMVAHYQRVTLLQDVCLKGNTHQILLSEMNLPGINVPTILGKLGKGNPSKRRSKVAFVQRKCAVAP